MTPEEFAGWALRPGASLELEALRTRVAELEAAMGVIIRGKVRGDNTHPLGEAWSMVHRFYQAAVQVMQKPTASVSDLPQDVRDAMAEVKVMRAEQRASEAPFSCPSCKVALEYIGKRRWRCPTAECPDLALRYADPPAREQRPNEARDPKAAARALARALVGEPEPRPDEPLPDFEKEAGELVDDEGELADVGEKRVPTATLARWARYWFGQGLARRVDQDWPRPETALPDVVCKVLEAAEALAEQIWSDERSDEEQEALCKAVAVMRAAEEAAASPTGSTDQ